MVPPLIRWDAVVPTLLRSTVCGAIFTGVKIHTARFASAAGRLPVGVFHCAEPDPSKVAIMMPVAIDTRLDIVGATEFVATLLLRQPEDPANGVTSAVGSLGAACPYDESAGLSIAAGRVQPVNAPSARAQPTTHAAARTYVMLPLTKR